MNDDNEQTQEVAAIPGDNTDNENHHEPTPEPAPTPDILVWLVERVDSLEKHTQMLENRLSHLEMKNRF